MRADAAHLWFVDRLGAHLDRQLDAGDALDVAAHLAACESCATEYTLLLNTVELIRRNLPPLRAPALLRERVVAAIQSPARPGARPYWLTRSVRPWAAAAAVVALVGVGYGIGARGSATSRAATTGAILTAH